MRSSPSAQPYPSHPAGQRTVFALQAALRDLATRPMRFDLALDREPWTRVTIEAEPQGLVSEGKRTLHRYRRTLTVHGKEGSTRVAQAVNLVDLDRGEFVRAELAGRTIEACRPAPLPSTARIGEAGQLFDTRVSLAVAPDTRMSGVDQTSVGQNHSQIQLETSVTWTLEPWSDGHALWCIRFASPTSGSMTTEECHVITPAGSIVGAVMRIDPGSAAPSPHGKPSLMVLSSELQGLH